MRLRLHNFWFLSVILLVFTKLPKVQSHQCLCNQKELTTCASGTEQCPKNEHYCYVRTFKPDDGSRIKGHSYQQGCIDSKVNQCVHEDGTEICTYSCGDDLCNTPNIVAGSFSSQFVGVVLIFMVSLY